MSDRAYLIIDEVDFLLGIALGVCRCGYARIMEGEGWGWAGGHGGFGREVKFGATRRM